MWSMNALAEEDKLDREATRQVIRRSWHFAAPYHRTMVAAFLLGLMAQNLKICVDTLVQAHVGDAFKGRVFVLYDMVFNVALVGAAGIGAVVLPANGKSVPILVTLALLYLVVAIGFAALSRGLSLNQGTESVRPDVSVSPL